MKQLTHDPRHLFPGLRGYLRTLRNYFRTPKGRHDLADYARALAIIFFTAAVVLLIVRRLAT